MKTKSEAERFFLDDVREKKNVSRSYRNKRTHCGKGGAVRLPSDKLTKKELQKMNGQCETYKLNQPMKWPEFLAMPLELQITYVKQLRKKFNVPDARIARMLCVSQCTFSQYVRKQGIAPGGRPRHTPWDEDGWYLFMQGVDPDELPVECFTNADEHCEETLSSEEVDFICEQSDPFVEPQHEQYEEQPVAPADVEETQPVPSVEEFKVIEPLIPIIPCSGTMSFEGRFEDVLKTLGVMLGSGNGKIHIAWDVA